MKKQNFKNILLASTAALLVPLCGQLFVSGWHWTWHDFLFAWVFFNLLGFTYSFITRQIVNRTYRLLVGLAVIGFFATIWIVLATG
jgi:hypothetical protein